MFKIIFLFILTMGLTACTHLSKEECETADWSALGFDSAIKGKPGTHFHKLSSACEPTHVESFKEKYLDGRKEGMLKFCTHDSGYKFGLSGGEYENICPKSLEADFLTGYNRGEKEHELEMRARELEDKERELKRKEEELKREQEDKERELKRKEEELERKQRELNR
jgi:septin family protein